MTLAAALALAACGGGTRQNAHEPSGTFAVQVVRASFPTRQAVARPASLELEVRNTGSHTVPDVAITVDSFNYASDYPHLADDQRPIWVIERGPGKSADPPVETQEVSTPGDGQTAYVDTWALGRLAPGQTQTFTWHVMPVKPGEHTVRFTVAADLAGRAKARSASGEAVQGQVTVDVAGAPPRTHVDPETGRVVEGAFPNVQ